MNVFETHARIVADYASYIRSFINIADAEIAAKVEQELAAGKLWPDPLLQFNPAYEKVGAVSDVVHANGFNPHLADIFLRRLGVRRAVAPCSLRIQRVVAHRSLGDG